MARRLPWFTISFSVAVNESIADAYRDRDHHHPQPVSNDSSGGDVA